MSKDWEWSSFVLFDIKFSFGLRARLVVNPLRIPTQLLDFLRPKERVPNLGLDHNWEMLSHIRLAV